MIGKTRLCTRCRDRMEECVFGDYYTCSGCDKGKVDEDVELTPVPVPETKGVYWVSGNLLGQYVPEANGNFVVWETPVGPTQPSVLAVAIKPDGPLRVSYDSHERWLPERGSKWKLA